MRIVVFATDRYFGSNVKQMWLSKDDFQITGYLRRIDNPSKIRFKCPPQPVVVDCVLEIDGQRISYTSVDRIQYLVKPLEIDNNART